MCSLISIPSQNKPRPPHTQFPRTIKIYATTLEVLSKIVFGLNFKAGFI